MQLADPFQVERKRIFDLCSSQAQGIVMRCQATLRADVRDTNLMWHDIGGQIDSLIRDAPTFEAQHHALRLLSEVLNIHPLALYSLQDFATRITAEIVRTHSARTFPNGQYMNLRHWLALALLDNAYDHEALLVRIFAESLTDRQTWHAVQRLMVVHANGVNV